MENECGWCGTEFKEMDAIIEYKKMYFCDEDCLMHTIGARFVCYEEEV